MSLSYPYALLCFTQSQENSTELEWLIVSNNKTYSKIQTGTLAECKAHIQDIPAILLAPGANMLLTIVNAPIKSKHLLQQTLAYAIEEWCGEDIEQLHLAIAPSTADSSQYSVAVVDHALMQQWLNQLQQATIAIQHIIPDITAIPVYKDDWTVVINAHTAFVRHNQWQGFAVEKENLDLFLLSALQQTNPLPAQLRIIVLGNTVLPPLANTTAWLDQQPVNITTKYSSVETLPFFAEHITDPLWDLLQPPYRRKSSLANKKQWFLSASLLGLSLVIIFLGTLYQNHQLQRDYVALEQETISLYKEVFPEATQVNSPRVLIQRELDKRLVKNQSSPLFSLLNEIGLAKKANDTISLEEIRYDISTGDMIVGLLAPNQEKITEFIKNLQARSLQVQQLDTEAKDDRVMTKLQIGALL